LFESLEYRRLFAGGSFSPLIIYGTAAGDVISLSQSGNTLTVVNNRVVKTYVTSGFVGGTSPDSGTLYGISKVQVFGYGGNDVIKGDSSVMLRLEIVGGDGSDVLQGGALNDSLWGGGEPSYFAEDTLYGLGGHDMLVAASDAPASLWGGDGNDTCFGSNSADLIFGGSGNDSLQAGEGNDSCYGEAGYDTLSGGSGADLLVGGTEHDKLLGGADADLLRGNDGNDTLDGQSQGDELKGGDGTDVADYFSRNADLNISIDGLANDGNAGEMDNVLTDVEIVWCGTGNDSVVGSSAGDKLYGDEGNDTLRGAGGNDTISGESGIDVLHGDGGNDHLDGGTEGDSLYGGAGDDLMLGSSGTDVLVAIGGGTNDQLSGGDNDNGGSWLDEFWLDADGTETHNATSAEIDAGCVHRIASFYDGVSKELDGQDLSDPSLASSSDAPAMWHPNRHRFDGNPLFGPQGPIRTDINQGSLGDCYFLAGLASIAGAKSKFIRNSIADLGDGTYAVRFSSGFGPSIYFRVDNELPANNIASGGGAMADGIVYARLGHDDSMWVAIMEKAYAVYRGGDYDIIDGGWAEEPYEALGLDWYSYDVSNDNALQVIADALATGRAVSIDTWWTIDGFDLGDPLVTSHVYSVESVDLQAGTITLYNPWGTDAGSGSGAWVDGDNDGFVTFDFNTWFKFQTLDFYVALPK
jgi:Ca2+-binding RTX toxin-like protein